MFTERGAPRQVEVFESYAHSDERLRAELEKHLAGLKRSSAIRTWHDAKIVPGSEIGREITSHLQTADLVLLLVSADFLASDYCYSKEMKRAMARHESGEAIVIPVILRPVDWHDTPFAKLLALPKDGKPVTVWPKRDVAYVDIVKGIKRALQALNELTTAV
jgi:TIR domain